MHDFAINMHELRVDKINLFTCHKTPGHRGTHDFWLQVHCSRHLGEDHSTGSACAPAWEKAVLGVDAGGSPHFVREFG